MYVRPGRNNHRGNVRNGEATKGLDNGEGPEEFEDAGIENAEGPYKDASPTQKRKCAKAFLTRWCAAIAQGEGALFEEVWGLKGQGSGLETPEKKKQKKQPEVADDVSNGSAAAVADDQ